MSGMSRSGTVFWGPITLKELKKSIEVDEEIIRRRIAKKKAAALKENKAENDISENHKNEDNDANRTYELLEPEENHPEANSTQNVLNDVTQIHNNLDETQLLDLSTRFAKTSMKPMNLESTSERAKTLLDETVNFNESKFGARLPTPLPDKISKSRCSTRMRKCLESSSREANEENVIRTPRVIKLSDTFITDMIGENVLNATIPEDSDCDSIGAERVGTPDIFKQKRNEAWKDSPKPKQPVKIEKSRQESSSKNSTLLFAKSPAYVVRTQKQLTSKKTPIKSQNLLFAKSPKVPTMQSSKKATPAVVKDSKHLFRNSPVAAYVHRGVGIQSMSKAYHNACVEEHESARSKSDHKGIKQCKIPVPAGENVKRKLDLGEAISRRPLFSNPKDISG